MKACVAFLLQYAAKLFLKRHQPYLIGITGSVGKTTCRMIIAQMLQHQLPGISTETSAKNFNSEIGLCLAILGIETYTPTFFMTLWTIIRARAIGIFKPSCAQVLVLEYGIDHPGDMQHLLRIATPHIGIFTGVDRVHAAYFPDEKGIFQEKVLLIDAAKEIAFWSKNLSSYLEQYPFKHDALSFALSEDQEADIGFSRYNYRRVDEQIGTQAVLRQGDEQIDGVRTNLLGEEHMGYLSLAYEIAQIVARKYHRELYEPDMQQIDFVLQPGRSTVFAGARGSILLDSSYNASPQSMQSMIRIATQIRQELFPDRKLVLCLGEMRELGDYTEEVHQQLAERIVHADELFLIGESVELRTLPKLTSLGYAGTRTHFFDTPVELGTALEHWLSTQKELALVLFKGSQNTIFLEEAIKQVLRFPQESSQLCRQDPWWAKKKAMK